MYRLHEDSPNGTFTPQEEIAHAFLVNALHSLVQTCGYELPSIENLTFEEMGRGWGFRATIEVMGRKVEVSASLEPNGRV